MSASINEKNLDLWFQQDIESLFKADLSAFPTILLNGDENELEKLFNAAVESSNQTLAAAAVIAAVNCIWNSGTSFRSFSLWLERTELLLSLGGLSPIGLAALEINRLTIHILWDGPLKDIIQDLDRVAKIIKRTESDSIEVLFVAAASYIHIMAGNFYAAEQRMADASYLLARKNNLTLPAFHLASTRSLLETVRGGTDVEAGEELVAFLRNPATMAIPPAVILIARCHLLLWFIYREKYDDANILAKQIKEIIISEHNYYLNGYVQFALGVSALSQGKFLEALVHSDLAAESCGQSETTSGLFLSALLRLQALVELGEEVKAQDQLQRWLPRWTEKGFYMLAVAGCLEVAQLHFNNARINDARLRFEQAVRFLPKGETLPDYHRNAGFAAKLQAKLFSVSPEIVAASIESEAKLLTVTALGEFKVLICGEQIYDRKWHGNKTKLLLKALIAEGGYKVSLDRLSDLLWPDADGQQARQNLKVTILRLRRLVESNSKRCDAWLVQKQGAVSIKQDLGEVDVLQFEILRRSNCLQDRIAAMKLYQGDFLPGDESESWIIACRERLRKRYVQLIHTLTATRMSENQFSTVEKHLLSMVEKEPADGLSFDALTELYHVHGKHSQAERLCKQKQFLDRKSVAQSALA